MGANIYLIASQVAGIVDFSTPLGRLGFAGMCFLALIYFGFFWYLVFLPVDKVREDVLQELQEKKQAQQTSTIDSDSESDIDAPLLQNGKQVN